MAADISRTLLPLLTLLVMFTHSHCHLFSNDSDDETRINNSSSQGLLDQSDETHHEAAVEHHGIHVANWKWSEIGLFFAFTLFVLITGLAKVAFHHAHFLSSHIPESCLMILLGVSVGVIIYISGTPIPENNEDRVVPQTSVYEFAIPTFTPRLFFLVLLPPVILEAAYSLYDRAFAFNFQTILLYAVIGTLINTFTIGPILFGLSQVGVMGLLEDSLGSKFELTLLDSLVFSALISAVDPVAVLAIFQEVGVNKDLYFLVFGESLLNDAVTVVLYTTMETFCEMPEIEKGQYGLATVAFFTVSLGGCAVGVVFGLLTALITRTTNDVRVVEPLAVLGVAYLSYLCAEMFHFSGIISIIFCGIVQAHYALKNISQKSYVTVKYFTRMISSTCDAIIFLFLGMVLVNDRHIWHSGFVLWSLLVCFICRFFGVFSLTALANMYRVKPISVQEQFIMAYGGLRGAVAFSLAEMLQEDAVRPRNIFVTTTLVVILFTVFIQGGTIKPLVNALRITRSSAGMKSLNEELGDHVLSTMMAGIEEVSGLRADFYIRRKFEQMDTSCMKRIFLKPEKQSDMTILFEKLALTEHFAHLYGPVAMVEDKSAPLLHVEMRAPPCALASASKRSTMRMSVMFPGVEFRPSSMAKNPDGPPPTPLDRSKRDSDLLKKAILTNPFIKSHEKYDRDATLETPKTLDDQLHERHLRTLMITSSLAAEANHKSSFDMQDAPEFAGEFDTPKKLVHVELDEEVPEEVQQGIHSLLDRAEKRSSKRFSLAGDRTSWVTTPPWGTSPTWDSNPPSGTTSPWSHAPPPWVYPPSGFESNQEFRATPIPLRDQTVLQEIVESDSDHDALVRKKHRSCHSLHSHGRRQNRRDSSSSESTV